MKGKTITLLDVILRAFLIQLPFDARRMQGTGFLFSISPLLRRLYADDDLAKAYKRHLGYFNTHPYMASVILGAVAAAEEKGEADRAIEMKKLLAAPLASIGDDLFWMALRPLAAIIGLQLLILGYGWGIILFLIAYNLPHLFIRTAGFYYAYRFGLEGTVRVMRKLKPKRIILFADISMAAFLGTMVGLMLVKGYVMSDLIASFGILAATSFAMMRLIGKARISAPTWALILISASILVARLVEIW
ncbi:PTS system mannose/fructose/sorbose family transporter subunit IID [Candidatus Poribacteria bacterium]|nr:PTS system mannose/fructose/sorbose family transporter subunit IID [Candidatus Poribacteria bacterium]